MLFSLSMNNNTHEIITIQSGIPIPPHWGGHPKPRILRVEALKRMLPGESFFVPFTKANLNEIYATRNLAKAATGNSFISRTVTEDGERGTRIWRVS